MTCTGAVESTRADAGRDHRRDAVSRLTERGATRADDRISEAAMEDRKREGYF
jgi:sulfate adenylyltransferase subunit 2